MPADYSVPPQPSALAALLFSAMFPAPEAALAAEIEGMPPGASPTVAQFRRLAWAIAAQQVRNGMPVDLRLAAFGALRLFDEAANR